MPPKPKLKDGFVSSIEYLRDEAKRNLRPDISLMLDKIIEVIIIRDKNNEIELADQEVVLKLISAFCKCSDGARDGFLNFLIDEQGALQKDFH